ncbi:MAG: DUF4105 domain-containing protein [Gammaproteobacteria bacterium]|nr:DUF4105 domain-containing protein [Gammaproteobacteria bacterium]MBT6420737.1 DUF4105 domain-containing protein [Gammaproteobacteria bacterium]
MLKFMSNMFLNLILFVFWLWCSVAIYFIILPDKLLAIMVAGLFALVIPLVFFLVAKRNLALVLIILAYIAVTIAWMNMPASNNLDWMPSVAKSPYVITQGNQVTVHDIRNFDYRTETNFTENYYTKTYDLDDLESLGFLLSYWGGGTTFAHTILSFGFSNGDYLAVSAETRLEKGERQNFISGFFNQYEMIYILADERDVIRLRTNFRKLDPEDVYFYPTMLSKQKIRQVFEVIIARVNKLYQEPEFYNTITHNCFTTLRADFNAITSPKNRFDWRIIANGYSDQMLYENGVIDTELSFPEAREYFHINQYVSDDNSSKDFSLKIRH